MDEKYPQSTPWLPGAQHAPVRDQYYPLTTHTPVDDLGDAMPPYTYRYKSEEFEPRSDGNKNGGVYAGTMAQALERHPLGQQIVEDTPSGKQLNGPALLSALAALSGRAHDRLNEHEQAIASTSAAQQDHDERLARIEDVINKHFGGQY